MEKLQINEQDIEAILKFMNNQREVEWSQWGSERLSTEEKVWPQWWKHDDISSSIRLKLRLWWHFIYLTLDLTQSFNTAEVVMSYLEVESCETVNGHRQVHWISTFPLIVKHYCETWYLTSKCRWQVISGSSSEAAWQRRGWKGIVLATSCWTRLSVATVAKVLCQGIHPSCQRTAQSKSKAIHPSSIEQTADLWWYWQQWFGRICPNEAAPSVSINSCRWTPPIVPVALSRACHT